MCCCCFFLRGDQIFVFYWFMLNRTSWPYCDATLCLFSLTHSVSSSLVHFANLNMFFFLIIISIYIQVVTLLQLNIYYFFMASLCKSYPYHWSKCACVCETEKRHYTSEWNSIGKNSSKLYSISRLIWRRRRQQQQQQSSKSDCVNFQWRKNLFVYHQITTLKAYQMSFFAAAFIVVVIIVVE